MDASLITPPDPADLCVDGPLQVDDLLEVVGSENTGVNLSGDLIQVVADALQLCDQRLRILSYMDLGLLCSSDQKIRHAHTRAESLFRDSIMLCFRQSDGKCLVSFSQIISPFVKMWLWSGFGLLPNNFCAGRTAKRSACPRRSAMGK